MPDYQVFRKEKGLSGVREGLFAENREVWLRDVFEFEGTKGVV